MDLITTAWRPSLLEGGLTVQVPANYGGQGGRVSWDWTPTVQSPPEMDPHIQQWNVLTPIIWNEYVLSRAEVSALGQVAVVQIPGQQPATWFGPGTASLDSGS